MRLRALGATSIKELIDDVHRIFSGIEEEIAEQKRIADVFDGEIALLREEQAQILAQILEKPQAPEIIDLEEPAR